MARKSLADQWYDQCMKERAEQQWNNIADGKHTCKVYLKLKNGKTLFDSFYFATKTLTKKEVEFIRTRTTKNNILDKLALVKNAEDVEVELRDFEKRFFCENKELHEELLDDEIEMITYLKNVGKLNMSKDVRFKIVAKIVE